MLSDLPRRAVAEGIGTAFLLLAIVGSGIMAQRLSPDSDAIALLANSIATGGALLALISVLQPVSGAHLNPIVTALDAAMGGLGWRAASCVAVAQVIGAIAGVLAAHAMFGEPWVGWSVHGRGGLPFAFSEAVATFGLVALVLASARSRPDAVPAAVSAYIVAAFWCTSSTSFANPAVTIARSLTGTFAGIRVVDVPPFVLAQLVGAVVAAALVRWLLPRAAA